MNEPTPEPVEFCKTMLLAAAPVPLPSNGDRGPAAWDAVWSELELRATLIVAHRVLALGHPIARIAFEHRQPVEKIQAAFEHLSDALARAAADPAAPYSPPTEH